MGELITWFSQILFVLFNFLKYVLFQQTLMIILIFKYFYFPHDNDYHNYQSLFFFYSTKKNKVNIFYLKKTKELLIKKIKKKTNKEVNLSYILNAPLIITGKYSRTGHERKVPSGDQISY